MQSTKVDGDISARTEITHEYYVEYLKAQLEASKKKEEKLRAELRKIERERSHYLEAYLKEKRERLRAGVLPAGTTLAG